jgi:hypothetical protein
MKDAPLKRTPGIRPRRNKPLLLGVSFSSRLELHARLFFDQTGSPNAGDCARMELLFESNNEYPIANVQ